MALHRSSESIAPEALTSSPQVGTEEIELLPLVQTFSPPLSLLLVIAGWWVLSRQNDRRERRKEIRGVIDKIQETITGIEATAHKYYQESPEDSGHTGMCLRRDLTRLTTLLKTLQLGNKRFSFDVQVMEFRSKVTGGDFETGARQIRVPSDVLFSEISAAGQTLWIAIEESFADEYRI